MKRNILDEVVYAEILSRIDSLSIENKRIWGTMTVIEMPYHCKQPIRNALGIITAKLEVTKLKSIVLKVACVYILNQFPRGAPTGKAYNAKTASVNLQEFVQEKQELLSLLNNFCSYSTRTSYGIHPLFGAMTHKEWGIITYMHLDHHLRQFSA